MKIIGYTLKLILISAGIGLVCAYLILIFYYHYDFPGRYRDIIQAVGALIGTFVGIRYSLVEEKKQKKEEKESKERFILAQSLKLIREELITNHAIVKRMSEGIGLVNRDNPTTASRFRQGVMQSLKILSSIVYSNCISNSSAFIIAKNGTLFSYIVRAYRGVLSLPGLFANDDIWLNDLNDNWESGKKESQNDLKTLLDIELNGLNELDQVLKEAIGLCDIHLSNLGINIEEYATNKRPLIIPTGPDDPLIVKIKEIAQSGINIPVQSLIGEERVNNIVYVKTPFNHKGRSEHMWTEAEEFRNGHFSGYLDSFPEIIKDLKYRQKIRVKASDVEDWAIANTKTNERKGGFLEKYLRSMNNP